MALSQGTVLIIANPVAQRGNGSQAAQLAARLMAEHLGDDAVELVLTNAPGHAAQLAANAPASKHRALVVLGGDGTVHEVVNGLMQLERDDRPIFGLVPVGSGNDYAQTLGMAQNVERAVAQLMDADERPVDVGLCNGVYFAETLSFGLDAAIALDTVERRERTGQQGMALYFASGIDQLLHHLDTFAFRAILDDDDDRRLLGSMHLFAVQNGPSYGGGFRICPEAQPDDGVFNICWAEAPMSVPEATFKFLRAKKAKHVGYKGIRFARASSIQIEFDGTPKCQVDGEELVGDSYSIEMCHHALRVFMGRRS